MRQPENGIRDEDAFTPRLADTHIGRQCGSVGVALTGPSIRALRGLFDSRFAFGQAAPNGGSAP